MGLLNIIRRMALRQKLPLRKIARRTGMSRNTIKKYLNAGTIDPQFSTPERQSKLDPFAEKLAGWLKTEAGKSRKQRRTLKQMHADLLVLGFDGSYNRVAAFARDWRADRQRDQQTTGRGTFVSLSFRRSSLTGARILPFWAVSARSFKSPTSSCRTAGPFWSGRICCKRTRCSLTPTGTGSGSSAACRSGAFTTICAPRSTVSVAGRTGRSTCASLPWQTTSHLQLVVRLRKLLLERFLG